MLRAFVGTDRNSDLGARVRHSESLDMDPWKGVKEKGSGPALRHSRRRRKTYKVNPCRSIIVARKGAEDATTAP